MRKYTDDFILSELNRCKQITGVPTTLRQIIRVSTIDKDVFVRYFKTHPDTDLLTGDEEKAFNKKMLVVHQREAALKKYGDSNFNNRDKYRSSHYKESVRDDIISKISELGTPVTSRYLSDFLPYNHDVIENYTIYFNIDGVLHGEDAKKFNSKLAIQKRRNYYLNNPNAISHMVSEVKKTKKERYGNPNYNNCEKMLDTKLSKLPLEFANLYYSREESIKFLESHSFISREQLKDYFGVSLPTIEHWIVRNDLVDYAPYLNIISQKELELRNILLPYGFNVYNSKKIIFPYEIDIYNPTCKIGIEFNGTYWHSSQFKERNYHYEKSKLAEQNGIRLIHFYEWEWDDLRIRKLVLDIIKVACGIIDTKLYARSCEIRKLTNKDVKSFLDNYHLQGHRNATVTYGLFSNDSLVQMMSFSNTKYNKNLVGDNSWEIIRSCSISNTLVVGGTSKLFHAFLTEYAPTSVFTYCDFNKFTGTSYSNLGMEFIGFTGPDMRWVINHFTDVVSRQPHRNKELKEISDAKLWGAGSKKFLFVSK